MPQNIMNNRAGGLKGKLLYDQYFDFSLYPGGVSPLNRTLKDIAYLDFTDVKHAGDIVVSSKSWEGAVNGGGHLKNLGFTGIDNGQIVYRKDRITNAEFYDIFTSSDKEKWPDLSKYGKMFFVHPVSGNTLNYKYPLKPEEGYVSLNGGFYQGYFKIDGKDYQTLPTIVEDSWEFNLRLRRRDDYTGNDYTLNFYNEENKGFFLFIGTRAENKFWTFYRKDEEKLAKFYDGCLADNGYCTDYNPSRSETVSHLEYLQEDMKDMGYNKEFRQDNEGFSDSYFDNDYFAPTEKEKETDIVPDGTKPNDGYFSDGYTGTEDAPCKSIEEDYLKEDVDLSEAELKTADGYGIQQRRFDRFTTDNKFILFNNTPTGFTTNTWEEGTLAEMERNQDYSNINYFPLVNNTPTGYTADNIKELQEQNGNIYRIMGDIYQNALGFKINEDGSISYRYLTIDCDNEPTYLKVEEETTSPGLVNDGEWCNIGIEIIHVGNSDKCIPAEKEKMKIAIKVNGLLKLISKELPMIDLRPLRDNSEKQETVPYNISIGGGSQGLAEAIYLDYYNYLDYTLPIEKYFGGSFIGDLGSFSFKI